MSGGLLPFIRLMLCEPVPVPGVFLSSIDPLTGLEIAGSQTPVKMVPRDCWLGRCNKCGWDNRFKNFPLLPLTIDEDENTRREVFVRACPVEATLDQKTTYHEFVKMERGHGEDGAIYTQPEWSPITVTRRMFYYKLYQFMTDFLPHYYKVLWHEKFDKVFGQHQPTQQKKQRQPVQHQPVQQRPKKQKKRRGQHEYSQCLNKHKLVANCSCFYGTRVCIDSRVIEPKACRTCANA